MHRPRHNGNSAIKKRNPQHPVMQQHNSHVNQQERQNNLRNQNRLLPQYPQRTGGMSMAVPIPQPQMQHPNSSRIPQYYYQATNFNQISKTATNMLNDKQQQHQYIFVQPSTAGPYFKFPPPPAPPPYPKPPAVQPYPKQNEPLPRPPLSKPSTPTQHLYETIPDKPPIPRPREAQPQVPSNRAQKKKVHHHNSQIQSNMSHQRKHMSIEQQQQLYHQQQQQLQYNQQHQQQLQKPIVSNISSGIQYNNEQRTSADGGVAQPHYSYGKQQQHHQQKGLHTQQQPTEREMPVGSSGELYDTRYIEEKIKESLLDNNNSRLPILYEEEAGVTAAHHHQHHHHQNDGSRIMVTKYAYRNSQIDLMAETAQAVAAASYYASR